MFSLQKIKIRLNAAKFKTSTPSTKKLIKTDEAKSEMILENVVWLLSKKLRFRMLTISKEFYLISLSERAFKKSEVIIRSIVKMSCDIITNNAKSRKNVKRVSRKKRADLLIYLIIEIKDFRTNLNSQEKSITQSSRFALHEEWEEIVSKNDVIFNEKLARQKDRKKMTLIMTEQYRQKRNAALTKYIPKMLQWQKHKKFWEYELTLRLFMKKIFVIWLTEDIEQHLINMRLSVRDDEELDYTTNEKILWSNLKESDDDSVVIIFSSSSEMSSTKKRKDKLATYSKRKIVSSSSSSLSKIAYSSSSSSSKTTYNSSSNAFTSINRPPEYVESTIANISHWSRLIASQTSKKRDSVEDVVDALN